MPRVILFYDITTQVVKVCMFCRLIYKILIAMERYAVLPQYAKWSFISNGLYTVHLVIMYYRF
jgi:hypothetical protein